MYTLVTDSQTSADYLIRLEIQFQSYCSIHFHSEKIPGPSGRDLSLNFGPSQFLGTTLHVCFRRVSGTLTWSEFLGRPNHATSTRMMPLVMVRSAERTPNGTKSVRSHRTDYTFCWALNWNLCNPPCDYRTCTTWTKQGPTPDSKRDVLL